MASVARSLGRPAFPLAWRTPVAVGSRSFCVSPFRSKQEDAPTRRRARKSWEHAPVPEYSPDLLNKQDRSMYDMMAPEERKQFDEANQRMVDEFNDPKKRAAKLAEIENFVGQVEREVPMRFNDEPERRRGFWADGETDEFALVEDGDESFNDDEITSMAHAEMELHREVREYARIAAWDMPLLTKYAKPFQLPPKTHLLRFRYTTYMGEQHPAEAKVVVELSTGDLTPQYLTEAQRNTFIKLVGPRYNPDTDIVRMSCERFSSQAQNKRFLGDLVNTLIGEAKQGDSFADIPLDLRHHKSKTRNPYPSGWVMTDQRRKQLHARRNQRQKNEEKRAKLVDGNAVISEAVKTLPSLNPALRSKTEEKEKVPVRARVGSRR